MGEWLKVVLLGIVEGITEFLPISSTGHLIITTALFNGFRNASLDGTFAVFIQLGAALAVIGFYRADFLHQARRVRHDPGVRRLWLGIAVAFLPAATLGFLLADWIEKTLFQPPIVAFSLIVGGLVFILIERHPAFQPEALTTEVIAISFRQALLIGLAQTTALIPGVSRSGASIIGGMLAGMSRSTATVFSFYLAVPTLGGATLYSLLTNLDDLNRRGLLMLFVGAAVSCVVAWLAMGWLLHYVARNSFRPFGVYRILAGVIILALMAAGRL